MVTDASAINIDVKRLIAVLFLTLSTIPSFGQQGKYGFEAGAGYTTFNKSYLTPTIQGYWLGRLSHTFYLGGAVTFQRYSMKYSFSPAQSFVAFGDILSLRQKSDYLFFTPRLEAGIGRTKHLFVNFSLGPGIYMGGNQWTNQYRPLWTTPSGYYGTDTATTNTSYNVPTFKFRYAAGFRQRFTMYGYWNLVFTEEFNYIPGNLSKQGPGMKTNYLSFTMGIMHKYPSVAMEED